MTDLQKIAVLIDADNSQLSKIEAVIHEVSVLGRIVVKRSYANWKKHTLKNWEDELKRLGIKAVQQFDYVAQKNATDMALVIDALDLLHTGIYDAFVIVASDSDYTPLAIRLRESGVYLMGIGEKKTPEAFRNACDNFIFIENLSNPTDSILEDSCKTSKTEVTASVEDSETVEEHTFIDNTDIAEYFEHDDIEAIHILLKLAFDHYQDDDEFVQVSAAGNYIKRAKSDFDSRTYGYSKLTDLIKAYPEKYKIKNYKNSGNVNIVAYKCLT